MRAGARWMVVVVLLLAAPNAGRTAGSIDDVADRAEAAAARAEKAADRAEAAAVRVEKAAERLERLLAAFEKEMAERPAAAR